MSADARADLPKLYGELPAWWPLLPPPAEYAEEAAFYQRALLGACERPCETLLELGSGGGNNASHLKRRFVMVLVDRSPAMLAVSRALNPKCEHVEADMRDARLGRRFDAVFIHDAVAYLTTEADLRRAIETASSTASPAARPCSPPTPSARPSGPQRTTAAAAACVTWNGSGTWTPPGPPMWSITPTSSATPTAACA